MASYTSTNRLTGLASGVDTDSYVEQLMYAASTKYYNYQRKLQKLQWQQEQYRTIISDIQSFQSKWLDITSSSSLRMQSTFTNKFTSSVYSSSGSEVSSLSVSDISSAGSHSVTVSQTASTASLAGSSTTVSGKITNTTTDSDGNAVIDGGGEEDGTVMSAFKLTYDGTEITVAAYNGQGTVESQIQSQLDKEFGEGTLSVSVADGGTFEISSSENGHEITMKSMVSGSDYGNFEEVKSSSKVSSSDTLASIMGGSESDVIEFEINGSKFSFSGSTKVSEMLEKVNDSSDETGVKMSCNSIAGVITLESTSTGSTSKINVEDTSGLFSNLGFSEFSASGTDAKVTVDGIETVCSSNSLEFDEFTVDISNATAGETYNISSGQDTQAIYDMISEFVEDYNTLIASIREKVNETRPEGTNGYYEPLTDDEKEEMTESEIEKWEEQAQKGLLHGDSSLKSFLSSVRSTFYAASTTGVNGYSVGLYSYGITTTSTTSDGGKLVIDEDELMDAITNDPDAIMNLFNDIGDSLNDIVKEYTGTNGILTNKAGIEGSSSEYSNSLYTQISDIEDRMETELTRLQEKEEKYYEMFSTMETLINNNNTTLTMLSSYFG